MATVNATKVATTGVAVVPVAASAGGDSVPNNKASGNLFVRAINASGGAITVNVASPTPCSQGGTHNLAVVVPAGAERLIGPLPAKRFGSPVALTYSTNVGLTIAPIVV